MPSIPLDKPGSVYLMRAGTLHKIGWSKYGTNRLATVKYSNMPQHIRNKRISVVHLIPCHDAITVETILHRRFRHCRVEGEWFELTSADVAWIKSQTEATITGLDTVVRRKSRQSRKERLQASGIAKLWAEIGRLRGIIEANKRDLRDE